MLVLLSLLINCRLNRKILVRRFNLRINPISISKDVLVIGAAGAGPFIEEILNVNPTARVHVTDQDTDALRHLKHKLAPFGNQVKLVRRSLADLSNIPENKFGAALLLWPSVDNTCFDRLMEVLKSRLIDDGQIAIISWMLNDGGQSFGMVEKIL
jgi:hypothetical protein